MEFTYWKDTDTMRITLRDDLEGYDSEEISPGIVAELLRKRRTRGFGNL